MSSKPASLNPLDARKTKKELLSELHDLRAQLAIFKGSGADSSISSVALRESESRFRQISESLPQLVWTCRADGGCDYLSPQWVSYTGIPEDVQHGYGWLDQIHPDDKDRVAREWAKTVDPGMPFDVEFRIRRHDGVYRWFKTRAIPLRDSAGNIAKWFGSNTDIDDLKKAEESLWEQAVLINLSPDAIIARKLDGEITFWSKGAEAIYGWTKEEVLGQHTHSLFKTQFPMPVRNIVQQMHKTGYWSGELVHTTKDGRQVVVESRWQARYDDKGNISDMLESNVDITERKRIEEALWESKERYKLVIAGARGGIWDWDVPNKRVFLSPQWKEMRGLSHDEISDREEEWSSRIHPEDAPRVLAAVQAHFEGRTPIFAEEYRTLCKDGSWKWISDRGMAKRDAHGNVVRMAGSENDITERKQAEEALRESVERLRLAQQVALIGTFEWNIQTGVNIWTPELEAMYGLPKGGFPGTQQAWEQLVYHEDRAEAVRRVSKAIENGDFEGEWRVVWPDGTVHWIQGRGFVFRDATGKPFKLIGINIDVTERKQAVEALMEAKLQAELYLDLMGHDISNMHQIILGQLQLAEEIMSEEGKLEAADRELIEVSIKNLLRSAKLIDNVKNLQRLQAGDYSRVPIDLGTILDDAVATYSGLPEKKVTIDYRPVTGYVARVNPLIKEVIYNLLDNAVKHSGDEVKIGIKVGRAERNGLQYHRVSIEDNGPGIPDEKKEEVFHRLKRGQTKARGTGLGLYLVKTLVESFEGIVELEDRVKGDYSQGSRFTVYLPAVKEDNNGK